MAKVIVSDWFDEKFNLSGMEIFRTKYWIWSLRCEQPTVGATVLSLLRPCLSLSDVTVEEFAGLKEIINIIEKTYQSTYYPDKINYLALMMIDPHVHFHVIPRYERSRDVGESSFDDKGWPAFPSLKAHAMESYQLVMIKQALKIAAESN